jgi:predicted  nucleic acid-binding Zn-ribbon protein
MSALHSESVAPANRDALRASASASVASSTAWPAAAASSSPAAALLSLDHELAAVKQRIEDNEIEIASVATQVTVAVSKRDACEVDDPRRLDFVANVQRLSKEKEQLRDEKALLLKKEERLCDELKRKETLLEQRRSATGTLTDTRHRLARAECNQRVHPPAAAALNTSKPV